MRRHRRNEMGHHGQNPTCLTAKSVNHFIATTEFLFFLIGGNIILRVPRLFHVGNRSFTKQKAHIKKVRNAQDNDKKIGFTLTNGNNMVF